MSMLAINNSVKAVAIGLTVAASVAWTAAAQDLTPLPPIQQAAPPPAAPTKAQPPAKTAAAKPAAGAAPSAAGAGSDAALRQRVEQLEEQIVDMQVVIGTLESLAKTSASNVASPQAVRNANAPASGADGARVSSLEAQVQTLSQQVQQLQATNSAAGLRPPMGSPDRRSELAPPAPIATQPDLAGSGFGSTTVTAADAAGVDQIGGLIAAAPVGQALPPVAGAAGSLGGAAAGDDPKQLYESAYGNLLNQNYPSAQSGFEEFLRLHPKDALAPDALFWLGEAHYMQKNYSDAAEAFDLVASSYGASTKAPEAQLRRAATLVQLGRKEDACAALRQLNTKYPNARAVLKSKADAERQRAGCA